MKRKRKSYFPDRGNFVCITLNPTAGHEQAGRRLALVISPKSYNRKTGLCVLCPATRQKKGESLILNSSIRYVSGLARFERFDSYRPHLFPFVKRQTT